MITSSKPADIRKIKQALEMHCVKPTLNYKIKLGCESCQQIINVSIDSQWTELVRYSFKAGQCSSID